MMECFCCGRDTPLGRQVKIREADIFVPNPGPFAGPGSYPVYVEQTAYESGVVCPGCYRALDRPDGTAAIGERRFTIAVASRFDRARPLTEDQYRAWRRAGRGRLGPDDEAGGGGGPS
jgi:hypothetical protein